MVETTQSNRNTMILAEKTALVVIDLQQGIAHPSRQGAPHESSVVVGNTSRLARAFAEEGGFVVLVRISSLDGKDLLKPDTDMHLTPGAYPAGWDDIVPELAEVKGAHVVTKRQWGAFYGTDLDLQLRRRGIDTIVLCGISTSIGVDTTAREAFQHGYQQIFVEDAMAASTKEEHEYVCRYIFPRIGKIRSTEEVLAALR